MPITGPIEALTVPGYPGQLRTLSPARRPAFTRRLQAVIREAFDAVGPELVIPSPLTPALRDLAVAAGATCGGHCYARGGEPAYVDEDTFTGGSTIDLNVRAGDGWSTATTCSSSGRMEK